MRILMLLCLGCSFFLCQGQKQYLEITTAEKKVQTLLEQWNYQKQHDSPQKLQDELARVLLQLQKTGYIEAHYESPTAVNDTLVKAPLKAGRFIPWIQLQASSGMTSLPESLRPKTPVTLPFSEWDQWVGLWVKKWERNGYPLATAQLTQIHIVQDTLKATLTVQSGQPRKVNAIVVNGYEKFPTSHKKELERLFRNQTFNQENLEKLHKTIGQFRFVRATKYPEILFTTDSTKVFVYLEKVRANTFDGFLGFANSDGQQLVFNGYLDVSLTNVLNNGERMNLYWKSNGEEQRTFNVLFDQPYIFKSPLALKAQLNIFRQDSTFQNTQTNIDIGYCLNYASRVYLGYQAMESSDINNANTALLRDFKNRFLTAQWLWIVRNTEEDALLFPDKTLLSLKLGWGSRTALEQKNSQFQGQLNLHHQIYLNKRNSIALRNQTFVLQSSSYLTNELFRFGGINSVRGFNENTLQANFMTALLSEYRYTLSNTLYLHSVLDYGYFQDQTTKVNGNLLGIGFGFGLLNKNGLLNFVYANGTTNDQAIKLNNSIVQISLKTIF